MLASQDEVEVGEANVVRPDVNLLHGSQGGGGAYKWGLRAERGVTWYRRSVAPSTEAPPQGGRQARDSVSPSAVLG
jgi:hypothetical protein